MLMRVCSSWRFGTLVSKRYFGWGEGFLLSLALWNAGAALPLHVIWRSRVVVASDITKLYDRLVWTRCVVLNAWGSPCPNESNLCGAIPRWMANFITQVDSQNHLRASDVSSWTLQTTKREDHDRAFSTYESRRRERIEVEKLSRWILKILKQSWPNRRHDLMIMSTTYQLIRTWISSHKTHNERHHRIRQSFCIKSGNQSSQIQVNRRHHASQRKTSNVSMNNHSFNDEGHPPRSSDSSLNKR